MSGLTKIGAKWTLAHDQRQLLADVEAQLDGGQLAPPQAWRELCLQLLRPEQPFELHQQLFGAVYSSWGNDGADGGGGGSARPPPPVWLPDPQQASACNVARFMATFQGDLAWASRRTGDPAADWALLHAVSCDNPDVFWGAVLGPSGLDVAFAAPPTRALQAAREAARPDGARWLPGARLNIAAAALLSPRAPGPDAPALLVAPDGRPTSISAISWGELRAACWEAAAAIAARWEPGTPLAVAMPMTPRAAITYLAIIAAGCVAVSIADSFSAREVATRLRLAGAAAIFTQDVITRGGKRLPLYARMLEAPGLPPAIVVQAEPPAAAGPQQQQGDQAASGGVKLRPGDVWWREFLATSSSSGSSGGGGGSTRPLPHIVDAGAPAAILFSSGTTGEPKAIPWSHTTPLRCAVDAWAHHNLTPGAVVAWPTNLGWMMGPWLLFGALINGATVALYQGAPLGRDFGEFVAAARVTLLGLVPSMVKAWRASGCMAHLDWSSLAAFSSTGEASSPGDYHWLASRVPGYRPVIEYCGGTEIGGAFLSGCLLQPQAPATFSTPTLGARLVVLAPGGQQVALPCSTHRGGGALVGELALVPPMLGSSQRLLLRDHASTYYADMPASDLTGGPLRRHGDEIEVLPGGYYRALGRCDDTMNLGGIKVSSVELERVVQAGVPGASEVAAVGVPTPGGGPELLHLFVVPTQQQQQQQQGEAAAEALRGAAQAALKGQLNPLFKVHRLLLVPALPRTASNKVMRRLLRDQLVAAGNAQARL